LELRVEPGKKDRLAQALKEGKIKAEPIHVD